MLIREKVEPIGRIDDFILNWHQFPIDYWWRKKHNIPFGSKRHRDMNFIDMLIEYREEYLINEFVEEYKKKKEERENNELGLNDGKKVVKLTKQQIDEDYDNLDLSQFDKK